MTIVSRREGMVLVDAPIGPTDRIITQGVQKVRDGQRVELVADHSPPPIDAQVKPAGANAAVAE